MVVGMGCVSSIHGRGCPKPTWGGLVLFTSAITPWMPTLIVLLADNNDSLAQREIPSSSTLILLTRKQYRVSWDNDEIGNGNVGFQLEPNRLVQLLFGDTHYPVKRVESDVVKRVETTSL